MVITQDDSIVDIASSKYAAGVRLSHVIEKYMISTPLGKSVNYAVVGSPEYFRTHAIPARPQDLPEHTCIQFLYPGRKRYQWQFSKDSEHPEIDIKGMFEVNDLDMALKLALEGAGMNYVLYEMAEPYLLTGKLVSVIQDWLPELSGFYLYYLNRKHSSAASQSFVEYIKNHR